VSTGEFIGWLSSDDAYYDAAVVSNVVATFLEHPEAALVYGHAVLIDTDGYQLQAQWVPPPRLPGLRAPMHIFQPAAFIRRSALGDTLVDDSYDIAMDTELWLRLARSHAFVRLNRILAAERHHAARKSHTRAEVGEAELSRLVAAYGASGARALDAWSPKWRIAFRLAGLVLVPAVQRNPSIFRGGLDSRWGLIRRQALLRRSQMRSGQERPVA
jgi:hypothetical protein